MKLRLKPNSIRLRLNQVEVSKFAQVGELTARIEFPGPGLTALLYRLRVGSGPSPSSARFENGELTVSVPENEARNWASGKQEIGLYYDHSIEGGKSLRVIIEKDFQSIEDRPDEFDPSAYPNPFAKTPQKSGAE